MERTLLEASRSQASFNSPRSYEGHDVSKYLVRQMYQCICIPSNIGNEGNQKKMLVLLLKCKAFVDMSTVFVLFHDGYIYNLYMLAVGSMIIRQNLLKQKTG